MKPYFLFPLFLAISCGEHTHHNHGHHDHTGASSATQTTEENITSSSTHLTFPSLDSVPVAARLYEVSADAPVIVLCHQARFNKFEYSGIAEKLNEKGFNCLAIDQRSGGPIADQINETQQAAIQAGKPTDYLDAEQDMVAAVNFAAAKYGAPVILWGSSYSSTLAPYIGATHDKVAAVVSFSPGDYLAEEKGSLVEVMNAFTKPFFFTSSKREATELSALLKGKTLAPDQVQFIPDGDGHHGSRALWESQKGGEEYWTAISAFLEGSKFKPVDQ